MFIVMLDIVNERGDNSLCCNLLSNKYPGQKSIFQVRKRKCSQFWRFLLDVRNWYQMGCCINIKSGQQTRFWHDRWLGDCALKVTFPNLFQIASHPNLEVAKAVLEGQWHLEFRRQLNGSLWEDWRNLQELLDDVSLSDD